MKKLSDMLGRAIERTEVLRLARAQAVMRRWQEAVGPAMAGKTRPDRYENGVLWIATDGAAWSQEVMLAKEIILARLNAMAEEKHLFEDLRAGVRKARRSFEEDSET